MRQFKITTGHSVYEDDFNEGELDFKTQYSESKTVTAENPVAALKQFYSEVFGKTLEDWVLYEVNSEDDDRLYDSWLVDEDCCTASPYEIEQWKEGKHKLYSNNVTISIAEILPAMTVKTILAESQPVA
jgi:hypothetical protein